ncbi:MAG: PBP1A family penicillin-binding protein [Bacteroidetes bacterium]|nr:MAG: PBP1A family penicillin-binding protein [Bacteroidota bacterium]
MTPKKFFIILLIVFFAVLLITAIYVVSVVSYGLPSIDQLENPKQNFATQIFSADGELLDHFYIERRVSLPFDSIPPDFINALIAVEDRKFMEHWGVHATRIFKAAIKNTLAFRTKEGASTITMQLARNLYFTPENSLKRKIREAFTAIQIEKRYTKNEILEMYINTVAFGRGAYGIQVASRVYFNKSPHELTTSECAFLVGLLKAPERYNGIVNYERAITRRNLVLSLMRDEKFLSDDEYVKSAEEPLNLAMGKDKRFWTAELAPHFVEMIRQKLSKENSIQGYDLYRDGLVVYTTLDSRIQRYAKEAVEEHLTKYQQIFNRSWSWGGHKTLLNDLINKAIRNRPDYIAANESKKSEIANSLKNNRRFIDSVKNSATTLQCGVVVLDPITGAILGMVGASSKFMKEHADAKYSLNHVTQIRRQPGSSFKPFVYASSLGMGMNPQSVIECGPYTYTNPETKEVWEPRGTGHCEPGETTTLYQALAASINTVSARLITQVTNPEQVVNLAHRMGIESDLYPLPALSLGGAGEVSPLEMASAFSTFANQGIHVKPYFLTKVEDHFGNVVQQRGKTRDATDVLDKRISNQMTYMMEAVVNYGTGSKIRQYFKNVAAAGKTGTTNDFADAWFVGFTPQLVCAIWVGFDDQRVTFTEGYGYASNAAAPIFGILMNKIYNDPKLPYKQKEFSYTRDSTDLAAPVNIQITPSPENFDAERQPEGPPQDTGTKVNKPKIIFPMLPKQKDSLKINKQMIH